MIILLDLKRIIYERNNEYKNMILNRLDDHSNELQSFNINRIYRSRRDRVGKDVELMK